MPDEDTGKVELDLDGNLVDERQRRKKKDKRTKNTDDENENHIARCDEGRRVKVGVKKQNIEDNEGQKQDEKETKNEVIDARRLMKWTAQLHILFRTSLSYVVLSSSRSLSDFLDSVSSDTITIIDTL